MYLCKINLVIRSVYTYTCVRYIKCVNIYIHTHNRTPQNTVVGVWNPTVIQLYDINCYYTIMSQHSTSRGFQMLHYKEFSVCVQVYIQCLTH